MDPRTLRPVVGLPYNRSFTLYTDRAQTTVRDLTGYTLHFTVKDFPGRLGTVKLHIQTGTQLSLMGTGHNVVRLALFRSTTQYLKLGVYEIVAVNDSNAQDVVPVSRGRLVPQGQVTEVPA